MEDDVDIREKIFHNAVREYIIWLLLFILLYVSSYATICAYRRRPDREAFYRTDYEEAVVYRIALWICTFTLAVSGGAVLLLPLSIVANEALIMFPKSYYFQWGVMSRVYEAAIVLCLLVLVACGLAWVVSALVDGDSASRKALFDVWNFYIPYLYSCISLLGVLMLLGCTPAGFARLFTVMGELIVKPKYLRNLEEEITTLMFEESSIVMRLQSTNKLTGRLANGHASNGSSRHDDRASLEDRLNDVRNDIRAIEKRKRISSLRRNVGYPLVMVLLLVLAAISVLMVVQNTLELLIGVKALPRGAREINLGISSFSMLGPVGAALEITITLYLILASIVGFYSLPYCQTLKPRLHDTSMPRIIGNCAVILIMSSALPVLCRSLGITNFDLIGAYGTIEWLSNLYLILSYNVLFAVTTGLCLTNKFTAKMRRELYLALTGRRGGVTSRSVSTTNETIESTEPDHAHSD